MSLRISNRIWSKAAWFGLFFAWGQTMYYYSGCWLLTLDNAHLPAMQVLASDSQENMNVASSIPVSISRGIGKRFSSAGIESNKSAKISEMQSTDDIESLLAAEEGLGKAEGASNNNNVNNINALPTSFSDDDLLMFGESEEPIANILRLLNSEEQRRANRPHQEAKSVVEFNGKYYSTVAATMRGRRESDEDAIVVHGELNNSGAIFAAVFDGHGGTYASQYCANKIGSFLEAVTFDDELNESIEKSLLEMDAEILEHNESFYQGTTGTIAIIKPITKPSTMTLIGDEMFPNEDYLTIEKKCLESDGTVNGSTVPKIPRTVTAGGPNENIAFQVTVANVGDSRAILLHENGSFSQLTRDHKPSDPEETARIVNAGGFVTRYSSSLSRVDDSLALSRAFGDGYLKTSPLASPSKHKVIAVPDTHTFLAKPGDILMLACDGVFEPIEMEWEFVSTFVSTLIHEVLLTPQEAALKLLEHAYSRGSGDNISVVFIKFSAKETNPATIKKYTITPQTGMDSPLIKSFQGVSDTNTTAKKEVGSEAAEVLPSPLEHPILLMDS